MSDNTFERDLRVVLRDLAPTDVPASLRDAVAAVPRTHTAPRHGARADRAANRRRFLAFAGIAAVTAVAAVGLALALGGSFNGQVAGPPPTIAPSQPAPTQLASSDWIRLTYGIVDQAGASSAPDPSQTAADAEGAFQIAANRLQSEGIPYAGHVLPDGFSLTVPNARMADAERIIGTTGDLEFVPMGHQRVEAGTVIDLAAHPPLFGAGSFVSATIGRDQTGNRTVDLVLASNAQATFATYTAGHIGEYVAIVLDGQVLDAPVIQSAIPNGQVQVQSGGGGFDLAAAERLVMWLQWGPMPRPLMERNAEPVAAPGGARTPEPAVSPPTSAPSEGSSPLSTKDPGASHPFSAILVANACLGPVGHDLPTGYEPGPPLLMQDDGSKGNAMFALPVKDASDRVSIVACRFTWQPDGTVSVVATSASTVPAAIDTPAVIDEVVASAPGAPGHLITGRATGGVKRIVAEFADGSSVEAARADSDWMIVSSTDAALKRVVAYGADGTAIWSGTAPNP